MSNEQYEKLVEQAIDDFKKKAYNVINELFSKFYTECLPFASDDAQYNAQKIAERSVKAWLVGADCMTENVNFPWERRNVLEKIYDANKNRIENEIIKRQQEQIKELENKLKCFGERSLV